MLSDKFKAPNKSDVLMLMTTSIAGLLGGVVLCVMEGTISPKNLIMGTVAGTLGVVVFNIDREDWIRLVVASVLCGVSWQSVLDTGKQFLQVKNATTSSDKATDLASKLTDASAPSLPTQITALGDEASRALSQSADVKSPVVQTRIDEELTNVVSSLNEVAPKEPEKVVEALTHLGRTATKTGNLKLWRLSADSLKTLSNDRTLSPAIRSTAGKAYESVKEKE